MGYHRPSAAISKREFVNATGFSFRTINYSLENLSAMQYIAQVNKGNSKLAFSEWKLGNKLMQPIAQDDDKPMQYIAQKRPQPMQSTSRTYAMATPSTVPVNKVNKDILNKELNSKNSLTPLTQLDKYEIAVTHRVDIADVALMERQILNPENIAKYNHKTTYWAVTKWIDGAIARGTQRTLDQMGMEVLTKLYNPATKEVKSE